jgi:hypothetical protein
MDQFSKAVSNNSSLLSKTGLGVGEASKKMSAAMAAGGKSVRDGMFALGMSMDQQADAYAQTMATMAGPTGKLKASNEEVATQTAAYAQNLKIVSSLTGEDAKAKQDKLRQENDTLAFNQKLAGMSEKQRTELNNAMLNMNESQQRALRERMIYGTVISKDLAIAEATNSGTLKSNAAFYNAVQDGSINADKARKIQSSNADETRKAALEQTALAMSQSEAATSAAKVQNDNLKTANQYTEEGVKAAAEAAKKRQAEGAAGKGGPEVDVMQMQQDFAVKIEDIAKNNLPKFATALTETISQIEKAVASLANLGAETPSMLSGILSSVIGTILAGVLPSLIEMAFKKGFGGGGGGPGVGSGGGSPKGSGGGGLRKNSAGQWINEKGQFVSQAEAAAAEKAGGVLGKAGKYAGRVGGVLAVGSALYEGYQGYNAAKEAEKSGAMTHQQADAAKGKAIGGATGGAAGGLAGAEAGALAGAALGSVVPVIGTAIGGIIGGLAGGALGYFGGSKVGEAAGGAIGNAVGAPSPKKQPTPGAAVPATQAELHKQAEEFSKAVGNPVPTKTENDNVVAALHQNNKLLHDIASTLDMQKKYTSQLVQLSA